MDPHVESLIKEMETPEAPRHPVGLRLAEQAPAATAELNRLRETGDALHGTTICSAPLKEEQPWHRIAIWMFAQGARPKEIAARLGVSYPAVIRLRKQPWFQAEFTRIVKETGRPALQALIDSTLWDSVVTLAEIRDNELAKNADRITAARELLNRGLGMPTVRLENKNVTPDLDTQAAELEELRRKNEELDRKLQAHGQQPVTFEPSAS